MVLHREDGILTVLHAFDRTVIEVEMGHFKWLRARDAPGVAAHREPVVLRRYKHLSCREIAHWRFAPPLPFRRLHRPTAHPEAGQLVAETDPENRRLAVGYPAQRADPLGDRARTPGPVRRNRTVGL